MCVSVHTNVYISCLLYVFTEGPSLYVWVYIASVHCWLSGAVSVGVQVQPVLSPVAVISEQRGIISSLQLS